MQSYPQQLSHSEVRNVIIAGSRMLAGSDPFGEFARFCMTFTLFRDKLMTR
jgi:hypothetical protein